MALALAGAVVTFDGDPPIDPGVVYIADDGTIEAVAPSSQAPPTGFDSARTIDTNAVIYPGLIDLHSHIAYNTLPLWEAAGVTYRHHDSWPGETDEPDYASFITWPARVLQQAAPEALIKYVEVKAMIGGTTSIQGAPRSTRAVDGWLVRIVDNQRFGGAKDLVRTSALQKRLSPDLFDEAAKLRAGGVLIYHVAEGLPPPPDARPDARDVRKEFGDLDTAHCLEPGLIGVHATALDGSHFQKWRREVERRDGRQRPAVVWSPFSNLWLYGDTTKVAEAKDENARIALGSDWSPSGTKHVLGELKVADIFNRRRLQRLFSDRELCEMVTANPGDALAVAWGPRVGKLIPEAEADVVVVERHNDDVFRNLIDATERHVQLVVIRGKPFYGTRQLMRRAGATSANAITVAGQRRSVVVRQPGKDARLSWPGVRRKLEGVRRDPVTAWNDSAEALATWSGPLDDPDAPLALFGDMPEGDLGVFGAIGEFPPDVEVPRLDSLEHDASFFDAVDRNGDPVLGELRSRYT